MTADLVEELQDYMNAENDMELYSEEEATGQPFRVRNLDQANWAVRKLRRIEARRQECRDLYEGEVAKLSAWLRKQEEEFDRERGFFEHLLKEYLEEQRQQDAKLKTIKLPSGKIGLRKQQPEFQRDNVKLLAWLKENRPELIKVKEEPDWLGLKSGSVVLGGSLADPDTGEVIDGVTVTIRPDRLLVEFETNK